MTAAGVKYYLGYDQVGSLKVVADGSGNLVKIIDYDSFGNIIADSNISFSVPFGFAGGLHDRDTGLVRFGYRDFDTDTGRWTAKDPIGFNGGDTDLWGYVLNDPINKIDPLGLETRIVIGQDTILGIGVGHVGLYTDRGSEEGGAMIYDPSGSYRNTDRANDGIFNNEEANWNSYLGYQKTGGDKVDVFTFNTTAQEEEAIGARARENGDPRGFNCADYISKTISGIGSFKNVTPSQWPSDLAKQLRKMKDKPCK